MILTLIEWKLKKTGYGEWIRNDLSTLSDCKYTAKKQKSKIFVSLYTSDDPAIIMHI